jgi:hypothetical protein
MRLSESLQIWRQLVQSNTENRRNAQLTGHQILQIVNPAFQIPKKLDYLMARLQKRPTLRCQREILSPALDEFHAKTPFQGAHLLADGTLRDAVHLRRLGKTRGFRQIGKTLNDWMCIKKSDKNNLYSSLVNKFVL